MSELVRFRIVVDGAPEGVAIAVQRGLDQHLAPVHTDRAVVTFEFALRYTTGRDGEPLLRGPEVQGSRGGRFIYVCWGVRAGDRDSPWDRRAKLSLESLTREALDAALADPTIIVEGRMAGTAADGTPAAASVPLLGGWRLVRDE